MNNRFLAMWDNLGLEYLVDITDMDHDYMIAQLKGEPFKTPFNIATLMLRARANNQRHYEIYIFETDESIDEEMVRSLFETDPQFLVDFIRREGNKLFSDRINESEVKIR